MGVPGDDYRDERITSSVQGRFTNRPIPYASDAQCNRMTVPVSISLLTGTVFIWYNKAGTNCHRVVNADAFVCTSSGHAVSEFRHCEDVQRVLFYFGEESLKINFQTVFCDFRSFTTAIWCKHQTSPNSTRKETFAWRKSWSYL